MKYPLQAVIFDMDGVLIDSEALWEQVRAEFAASLGRVWRTEDQHATMGVNTAAWARIMAERLDTRAAGLDETAVAQAIIARMKAKYTEHLPLRAGAVAAVQAAAAQVPVGLATGSPAALAQHVLQATGLDKVFAVTLCADDVARGKPAPDVYLAALRQLGVAPACALGIEDSGNGIRSLHAAGMGIIAAPVPAYPLAPEVQALAHASISAMTELDAALLERTQALR